MRVESRRNAAPADDPVAELKELAEAGRLAAEYLRAGELVDRLTGRDLIRAGRLLARLDPAGISRENPVMPIVTVGITGHGTLAAVIPALTAQLARHRMVLRPVPTSFDSYVVDLLDPDSEVNRARPDLVLCVLDPDVVFDDVPVPWRPEDVARAAAGRIGLIERIAERFDQAGRGTLALNTLPLLRRHTAALVDHRSRARLGSVWREANIRLLRLAEKHPSVVVLDLEPLVSEGVAVRDERLSLYAKAHLGEELLGAYAVEVGHLIRHLVGHTKKCVVLDLDDTLWGGVLGETGVTGVDLGGTRRGAAFAAFQRVVKQLGAQGVLLAVVSKNEPELVARVFREHPDTVLKETDFVAIVANWEAKHDNLRRLAGDLELSVDSFVFVDDSPFERELVRRELPGVAVVEVDSEPAWHIRNLARDGWFDTRELTADDTARVRRYRDEVARRGFLDRVASTEDYLRELGIRVRIGPATAAQLPRVSQLTLRTNQFNLTGARLQPPEVRELTADPATAPLVIHAEDRFGDQGLVGVIFTRREEDRMWIDNFLLSCRVFSRSIEEACLAWVLRHARDAGAALVLGAYRETARNRRVADFYPRNGFVRVAEYGDQVIFRHDLGELPPPPAHIRIDISEGEPA
ncbi:MAG TPA: HAD-IIIC family phosphatase [Amycolatopsis sp.]|uniref:HAD-IIIC family phosphatase n=1 Tax=Amycolatopsis sp. TaxID=37632 RepID=UPI002B48BD82|nr:HAD-IIIC family phosphatase [Amycolatopsis sp.]HKS43671.1 HAD-IIIC family phosphatase [Amycolatopsis sp.]